MKLLNELPGVDEGVYVAIDVATTGLSARTGGRVIEVGAVALNNGKLGAEFQSLVNPGVAIPASVQRIHGISAAMLQNRPAPEYAFSSLREFIGTSTLISHNAVFDMAFLRNGFRRLGLNLANRQICTLKMSRRCLPGLPNYKLTTVYRYLGGGPADGRQHRALTDARMAAHIRRELLKR